MSIKKIGLFSLIICSLCALPLTGSAAEPVKPEELTTAMFLSKVADVNKQKEWKYRGNKPCIVDFYATWCGPCKRIAPILDELANEYKDQIYIYKVDTDKEPQLSQAFNISSIPMLMFVPSSGKPVMIGGARSKEEYKQLIKDILLKK